MEHIKWGCPQEDTGITFSHKGIRTIHKTQRYKGPRTLTSSPILPTYMSSTCLKLDNHSPSKTMKFIRRRWQCLLYTPRPFFKLYLLCSVFCFSLFCILKGKYNRLDRPYSYIAAKKLFFSLCANHPHQPHLKAKILLNFVRVNEASESCILKKACALFMPVLPPFKSKMAATW